jgi:hypothetical protein
MRISTGPRHVMMLLACSHSWLHKPSHCLIFLIMRFSENLWGARQFR